MSAAVLSHHTYPAMSPGTSYSRCSGCRHVPPVTRRQRFAVPLSRRPSTTPQQGRAAVRRRVAASAASDGTEPTKGHAVLHDFCMGIPYGSIAVAGGLASLMFGAGNLGISVAVGGAIVCMNAFKSLKAWKTGLACTVYTSASAVVSAGMGIVAFQAMPTASSIVSKTAGWGLVALSAALSLFLIYNIAAGGNPPPSEGYGKEDGEASTPASTGAATA